MGTACADCESEPSHVFVLGHAFPNPRIYDERCYAAMSSRARSNFASPPQTIQRAIMVSEHAIVLADEALQAGDLEYVTYSNAEFVWALRAEHLTEDEIFSDAVHGMYVQRYLGEIDNGGFSQFLYNCRGEPEVILSVRSGLNAIGAVKNLAVYDRACGHAAELDANRLTEFVESEYFGENAERDEIDRLSQTVEATMRAENLKLLLAAFLLEHDQLVIMTGPEIAAEVQRRAEAVPDREARLAKAREAEPRFMQLIRAICIKAGLDYQDFDGGDGTHVHEGQKTIAWRFITDAGPHHMIDTGSQALLFPGRPVERPRQSPVPLLVLDAPKDAFGIDPYAN